ncbi:MAG: diacylglycerol kinase family protein, partial [Caulobacterales bacterium]
LTGLIINARSHQNKAGKTSSIPSHGVLSAAPENTDALDQSLAEFARNDVKLLVIDGGDGTVREVITRAPQHFAGRFLRYAILPAGKTNVLATDLGVPKRWTLDDALKAATMGGERQRTPIEILRPGSDAPELRGFLWGAAAFSRATQLAQDEHKKGLFGNLAIVTTAMGTFWQTLFGSNDNSWRAGENIAVQYDDQARQTQALYLLMATGLKQMPMGVRPFGLPRNGMKTLAVTAPPKNLALALPFILNGAEARWLERAGYMHRTPKMLQLNLSGDFILDGERYPGGDLTLRPGAALRFVVP